MTHNLFDLKQPQPLLCGGAKNMTFKQIEDWINWGDSTAIVYDSPNNRWNYSFGDINDVFGDINDDTEFLVYPWDEAIEEVRTTIKDNLLLKNILEDGECAIIQFKNDGVDVYVLQL